MPKDDLPEWERGLSAAAHLQSIISDAVLVGGTAAAVYAGHRRSTDADHVVGDLKERFDDVLAQLEAVSGWQTAPIRRPVLILGSLDGIETGIRQLIRQAPLEFQELDIDGARIKLPTEAEMLRIKAVLILRRNATRDYLDFAALADRLLTNGGEDRLRDAMASFDELYPQPNGESALQQLIAQLSEPLPYDLDDIDLKEYKGLDPKWHDWAAVKNACRRCALALLEGLD